MNIASLRCEMSVNPLGLDVANPGLSWSILSDEPFLQSAYQIVVASKPSAASDADADLWDSGKVNSGKSILIRYAGKKLQSRQRCYWRVRVWDGAGNTSEWSELACWEMGLLDISDWSGKWIGSGDDVLTNWRRDSYPAPYFRKTFNLDRSFNVGDTEDETRIYICGIGYYELYLNGMRVESHVLDPVVTHYDKRLRYLTYDVSGLLEEGENVIGVVLGNGWYNCQTAETWHFDKAPWRDYPKLLLQLEMDGMPLVVSGTDWKVSHGPILFDALRSGETYDARQELGDWSKPGYDDSTWKPASQVHEPGGLLQAQIMQPCRVMQSIPYVDSWVLDNGDVVYDIGQSMTGWGMIDVSGPAGAELVLRYSDCLKEDRSINTESIGKFIYSGDFQTDRYILKGQGVERWQPRFTYHGFRYIQISGITGDIKLEGVTGQVVYTSFAKVGNIDSSNETVNRLQKCTEWSYIGNFTGIPTDCPHREKNGWTGDAQLAAETGLFNYDAALAYRQWVDSIADSQRPNGQLPGIVPSAGWGYNWGSGPAWDSAFLLIPWYVYVYTGDMTSIVDHYDGMKRYVDYCTRMATDNIVTFGLGDWGHWDRSRITEVGITSTGYYYVCAKLLAKFAALTGCREDNEKYTSLANDIKASFNEHYYNGDGTYGGGEPTALGCALYLELVGESVKAKVAAKLAGIMAARDFKVDFGILGAKYIPRALADNGYCDEAYKILTQPEFPGWGFWLEHDATTLWEGWGLGASSMNHIMYGDISAWMYQYPGGITPNPDAPGFTDFIIKPHFPDGLDRFSAEHKAPLGLIKSEWRRQGNEIEIAVTVPHNSKAKLMLPDGWHVLQSGSSSFTVSS